MAGSIVLFSSTAATQAVRGVTTSRGAAPSARLSFAGRGTQSNALRLAAPRRGAVTKGRSPLQVAAVGPGGRDGAAGHSEVSSFRLCCVHGPATYEYPVFLISLYLLCWQPSSLK